MKKIQLPESQLQEVLYELINRLFIDRRTMMLSSGVHNLTARISDLRKKGVKIVSNEIEVVNKFGRQVSFVRYSLENKKDAVRAYDDLKLSQRSKLCTNAFYKEDNKDCEIKNKNGCPGCEFYKAR